jgi:hypothetical protein
MKIANRRIFFLIIVIFVFLQPRLLKAQTLPSYSQNITVKPFSFPLQLEMRVPFDPTAIPSDQKSFLIYELYLTNFNASPINLRRIELIDADKKENNPVAIFDTTQLITMVQPLGRAVSGKLTIAGGQSAIVYLEVISDQHVPFPSRIIHRVVTDNDSLEGATISTHNTILQVLSPPLEGANWIAADGPSNDVDNHHRRGVIILNGRAVDSRRYAIDWKKVKDGVSFSGDPRNVHSYLCYGEKVLAVADGLIIRAKDGLPDNIPGHGEAFHPAVPLTFETLAGNSITIDLGNGHFAYYMHLKPESLRVKVGDRVYKGQILANIGGSGDAREPHLHFEVTTSPQLLLGEGIPYLIDSYRLNFQKKGYPGIHLHELPTDKEIVDFEKKSVK